MPGWRDSSGAGEVGSTFDTGSGTGVVGEKVKKASVDWTMD